MSRDPDSSHHFKLCLGADVSQLDEWNVGKVLFKVKPTLVITTGCAVCLRNKVPRSWVKIRKSCVTLFDAFLYPCDEESFCEGEHRTIYRFTTNEEYFVIS